MLIKPRPRAHQRLYDALDDGPAHVLDLYAAVRGKPYDGSNRSCMGNLGPLVRQFNLRETDCMVVPGPEVYTYRLYRG